MWPPGRSLPTSGLTVVVPEVKLTFCVAIVAFIRCPRFSRPGLNPFGVTERHWLTFGSSVELLAESTGHISPEGVEDVRLTILTANEKCFSCCSSWLVWKKFNCDIKLLQQMSECFLNHEHGWTRGKSEKKTYHEASHQHLLRKWWRDCFHSNQLLLQFVWW